MPSNFVIVKPVRSVVPVRREQLSTVEIIEPSPKKSQVVINIQVINIQIIREAA